MRLEKHIIIRGVIHCLSGLRIGGAKEQLEIGGVENNIIRHPLTKQPYIPGSSLKGKMRSLLEYKHSPNTKDPCDCGSCNVCEYFGSFGLTKAPTRVLVRDAALTKNSQEILQEALFESGIHFAEIKMENAIERNTGRARSPRPIERVPAGTEFNFEISLRKFDFDDEQALVDFVLEGMKLLQQDYLGSSGGRGYGQIEFRNVTIDGQLVDSFRHDAGGNDK
ncbi:type III-A CRISPR-associated RAMP protein Csm3 [Paenibacillus tyrfis]|uniref:type III-A CRISPR-associated RAMP protein Csm3 n=1 Tax=Paenibacillus tyrfis TaxID=1501230 RepID=UPI0020A172CF|nr:type III-A CRISPR-associated RAMP protein Csm3 [Paenibacillus tyrfis]MCP1309506.1 type III-A CRISPR-associated RAMP protein Csm3 [Paenibacillus tyrfis]